MGRLWDLLRGEDDDEPDTDQGDGPETETGR
jgi:hypothetical protein